MIYKGLTIQIQFFLAFYNNTITSVITKDCKNGFPYRPFWAWFCALFGLPNQIRVMFEEVVLKCF